MVQLKQELKKSEMNRQELSAELRECRKIKVESGVSGPEDCEFVHKVSCHYYAVLILWCITRHWYMTVSELLFVSGVPKETTSPCEEVEEEERRRGARSQESEDSGGRAQGSHTGVQVYVFLYCLVVVGCSLFL